MSTSSRIGKTYYTQDFLSNIPDNLLLVEAAMRRGQSLTPYIEPKSPSMVRTDLASWKLALQAAQNVENPNRNPLYRVLDNVMIDGTLTSMVETRTLKVKQRKFMLYSKKTAKPNPDLTELTFEKEWFGNWRKIAMGYLFDGPPLIETWDFDPESGELIRCTRVNKYHVKPELGIVTKEPNDDKGLDFTQNPYYMLIGDKNELGCLFKAAPHVLAKKYALGAWAEFDEKVGTPFRTVRTNSSDKLRLKQLGEIMDKMGSAGWAVLREDEKVELLAVAGTDPTKCFEMLIAKLDSEVAMLIQGQAATSNSQNNKGTYGSLEILNEISEDRHISDLTDLKYLINGTLIPRLIELSPSFYGVLKDFYFEWEEDEKESSVSEKVDNIVKLSEHFDVDPKFVTETTGIPVKAKQQPSSRPTATVKKKNLIADVRSFYSQRCCVDHAPVAINPDGFEDAMLNLAKKLWAGKQKGVVDWDLLKNTATELREALMNGYSTDTTNQDHELLKQLRGNVYVFSGFKAYKELKEVSSLLRDENGDLKSWDDFKKDVLKINQSYNVHYLSSEYDHAVVSAQMAAQWQDIQANKDALPFLEFDATLDDRTTSTCRALDGTRLPVDDPFWDTYYLPLHWHERSVIRQVATGRLSDKSKIAVPELQKMFKGNVGKDGVIFPETHPYYAVKLGRDKARILEAAKIQEVLSKPRSDQFDKVFTDKKTGASVSTHQLADRKKDDYKGNLSISKAFAKAGMPVEILPEINYKEKDARKAIFPKLKTYTNPDLSVDGEYMDVKRFDNPQNIVKAANRADKQGAIACISDEWYKLTDALIEEKAKAIFKSGYSGDKIYFFKDGKVVVKNRKGG